MKTNLIKLAISILSIGLITACGGGGDLDEITTPPAKTLKIAYFGDSTTNGARILDYKGDLTTCAYSIKEEDWKIAYSPLSDYIKAQVPIAEIVKNYGVNGQTAEQRSTIGLADFEQKITEDSYKMVILNFGINDARENQTKEKFVNNMQVLVNAAQKKGLYVIVEKTNPIKQCFSNVPGGVSPAELLEQYRSQLNTLAGSKISFVDHGVWANSPDWHKLLADILHPNDLGYMDKAKRVADKINSLKL